MDDHVVPADWVPAPRGAGGLLVDTRAGREAIAFMRALHDGGPTTALHPAAAWTLPAVRAIGVNRPDEDGAR